jgi:WD40 repeat protein
MGNCLPLFKYHRGKYRERLDTPAARSESVPLSSSDYISSLCVVGPAQFVVSQEALVSVYKDFALTNSWQAQARVRSLDAGPGAVVAGGHVLEVFGLAGQPLGRLQGHERPASAIALREERVVSGAGDWSVRLWDLNRGVESAKAVVNWNVVTCLRWAGENEIVQAGEDQRIRIWDVRQETLREKTAMNTGDNFATCLDVKENLVLSGHRGFNNTGCEVKMWDLRKNEMVFSVKAHEMPVEGCKFVGSGFASCGKDGKLVVYDARGTVVETWRNSENKPLIAMQSFGDGIIVGSIEPKIMFFSLNPLTNKF